MNEINFNSAFHTLTGNCAVPVADGVVREVHPWRHSKVVQPADGVGQNVGNRHLADRAGDPPDKMLRRLVYVVNRRTVVDQTTEEVEKYRGNLRKAGLWELLAGMSGVPLSSEDSPLAVSTLRGQFADNREWMPTRQPPGGHQRHGGHDRQSAAVQRLRRRHEGSSRCTLGFSARTCC